MIASALDADMGVVLPGQTWRNQLPADHSKRQGEFASLPAYRARQVDPGAGSFAADFAEKLSEDDLEAQLGAGATIATTAAHVHEIETGVGRQNDLLLVRLAAEMFLARRGFASAPGRRGRRELYATLIVQGRHAADPATVDWLIQQYAELEGIDGYWIVAVNTHKSGRQLAGYLRLALGLDRLSERPTVTSCVGDPHLALLAAGVAATCAGLHGMSFKYPPDELAVGTDESDEDQLGLGIHTYHRSILGNAGTLGAEGDAIRAALFKNAPCPCGHHVPQRPPKGRTQIVAHNSWAVQADALAFSRGRVPAAELYLSRRVVNARRNRQFYGMSGLHPGFVAVLAESPKLRERERALGEG